MRPALLLALLCTACAAPNKPYTLYRASVVDHAIHTPLRQFDSKESCTITRGLYHQYPPGMTQYYGCERTDIKS